MTCQGDSTYHKTHRYCPYCDWCEPQPSSDALNARERDWRDALLRIAHDSPANPGSIAFEALRKHRPELAA